MTTLERNKTYKPEMVRIAEGWYWMQSASDPTRYYFTDTTDNTCECQAAQKGRLCWHLTTAQAMEAEHAAARRPLAGQQRAPEPAVVRPSGMDALLEAFGPV